MPSAAAAGGNPPARLGSAPPAMANLPGFCHGTADPGEWRTALSNKQRPRGNCLSDAQTSWRQCHDACSPGHRGWRRAASFRAHSAARRGAIKTRQLQAMTRPCCNARSARPPTKPAAKNWDSFWAAQRCAIAIAIGWWRRHQPAAGCWPGCSHAVQQTDRAPCCRLRTCPACVRLNPWPDRWHGCGPQRLRDGRMARHRQLDRGASQGQPAAPIAFAGIRHQSMQRRFAGRGGYPPNNLHAVETWFPPPPAMRLKPCALAPAPPR